MWVQPFEMVSDSRVNINKISQVKQKEHKIYSWNPLDRDNDETQANSLMSWKFKFSWKAMLLELNKNSDLCAVKFISLVFIQQNVEKL